MIPLPQREGERPTTHHGMPHTQVDQQPANGRIRTMLAERVFALPGVKEEPSGISVPGARALVLDPAFAAGRPEAFMVGREFAHLHPGNDRSLHMNLPLELAEEASRKGWAELHPMALAGQAPETLVMVYAPRNEDELKVVGDLVEESYCFAVAGRLDSRP